MKCGFCQKENIKEQATNLKRTINGQHYLVQGVPALFYEKCGEFDYNQLVIHN